MEIIDLSQVLRCETAGHSSKGNQLKWRQGNEWYKADYMGYEGLAEVVISHLLAKSNVKGVVTYTPVRILYRDRTFCGCKSRNFLKPEEELITAERLIRQFTGRSLSVELGRITEVKERILYLVEHVTEITGLKDFGAYLTAALEMDAVFLNEDRHVNNIAVIYCGETKSYRLCPYFDFGLSLYADTSVDFKLEVPLEDCRKRIEAKPFSRDFDEQLDLAEELYGKQVQFYFDERDIQRELSAMEQIYEEEVLRRAETVLHWQRAKYGYLFCRTKPAL